MPEPNSTNEIRLDLSDARFQKTMFFDDFAVRMRSGNVFAVFWRRNESGGVEDSFAVTISLCDLGYEIRRSLKSYIAKTGVPPSSEQTTLPVGMDFRGAHLVRLVRASRMGDAGELDMYFVPMSAIADGSAAAVPHPAAPVAALASTIQRQVDFLDLLVQAPEPQP